MNYIYIVTWCIYFAISVDCADTTYKKTCYKYEKDCDKKEYFADKNKAINKVIDLNSQKRSFNGYIKIQDIKLDSVSIDSINIIDLINVNSK